MPLLAPYVFQATSFMTYTTCTFCLCLESEVRKSSTPLKCRIIRVNKKPKRGDDSISAYLSRKLHFQKLQDFRQWLNCAVIWKFDIQMVSIRDISVESRSVIPNLIFLARLQNKCRGGERFGILHFLSAIFVVRKSNPVLRSGPQMRKQTSRAQHVQCPHYVLWWRQRVTNNRPPTVTYL